MLNTADLPAQGDIATLEALRAVADSQRHRILCLLIEEPLTPTAIAEKLDIARTRVYYHLEILRKHGFIGVVGERPVAAMVERTYRAQARAFRVDRALLAASASAVHDAQAKLLEGAADDLRAAGDAEVLVTRAFVRLTPEQAAKLRELLRDVAREEFRDDAAGEWFELVLALFPSGGTPQ